MTQWTQNWLPFLPLGDLPEPGIKPKSPVLAGAFFTTALIRRPDHLRPWTKLHLVTNPILLQLCRGNKNTRLLLPWCLAYIPSRRYNLSLLTKDGAWSVPFYPHTYRKPLFLLHNSVFVFQVFQFGICAESQDFGFCITSGFWFNPDPWLVDSEERLSTHTDVSKMWQDQTQHSPKEHSGPLTDVLRYIHWGSQAFVVLFYYYWVNIPKFPFFNYYMYIYLLWLFLVL